MYRRFNRLLCIALSAALLAVFAGCSQPDDVLSPVSSTKIILTPERLPTLPQGMIYELWLKKNNDDVISLGKFGWDSRLYRFYDAAGNRRDSIWEVAFDALQGKSLMISVENNPDPQPSVMGPVMLTDTLVDPAKRPMKMIYPRDFWQAQPGYSITSPTDGNSYNGQASGIWFAQYEFVRIDWMDTTEVRMSLFAGTLFTLVIDTIWDSTVVPPAISRIDTTNLNDLQNTLIKTAITNVRSDTNFHYIPDAATLLIDSLRLIRQKFDVITHFANATNDTIFYTDTIRRAGFPDSIATFAAAPFTIYDANQATYTTSLNVDTVDVFFNSLADTLIDRPVLDLNGTGWHYKGWVISPSIPSSAGFGKLSKPSWNLATADYVLNPSDAGILTTGTFRQFEGNDDSNPYSMTKRVPSFPGEDFLINLPPGVGPRGIYLADSLNPLVRTGTAFITLEPDNFNSDSTNFPLIIFTSQGRLPKYDSITVVRTNYNPTIFKLDYLFPLQNWASSVNGNTAGFPAVHVGLIRQ
jgi:hypothetical protein